jgi:hypothetical protein
MFYVCILYSKKEDQFATGMTDDLSGLVRQHKEICPESRLLFYECFICKSDARRRDEFFNTVQGDKELRHILRDSLDEDVTLNWQNA